MDRIRRWAWVAPLVPALIITLFALGAIASGVDATEFEQSTGTAWMTVKESSPATASYLVRLERLIGVGYATFGLMWAALAWFFVRQGDRRGWLLLWSMPVTLLGASAVFFLHGAQGLGAYYLTFSGLSVIGLILSGPTTNPAGEPR